MVRTVGRAAVLAVALGAVVAATPAAATTPSPTASSGGSGERSLRGTVSTAVSPLPTVTARSFVLADLGTGAVLAALDAHASVAPASTLKMLTAIVTMRRLDPGTTVIADAADAAAHGSVAGLVPARSYTVAQLWDALLLASGNDAALALARTYPGGQRALVAAMGTEAARIGAVDTHPRTPTGLDTQGQVTSAYDLVLIARDGLAQSRFARVVAKRTSSLPAAEGAHTGLANRNELLGTYRGAIGVKTGDTPQAGYNLVAAARRDGRTLVVALTASTQPVFRQAARLLDWGFATPASSHGVATLAAATGRAAAKEGSGGTDQASTGTGEGSSQPSAAPQPESSSAPAGGHAAGSWLSLRNLVLLALGLLVLLLLLVPVSLRPADGSEPRRGPRRRPAARAGSPAGGHPARPSQPVGARSDGGEPSQG